MRKLQSILALLILAALLGIYANWSAPRSAGHYLTDLRSALIYEEGTVDSKANLLAIRPELFPSDYRSPEHLRLKLAAILDRARGSGLLNEHSVVALPDQIGTWLLLGDERVELYSARSLPEAQAWLALDNPHRLAWAWLQSEGFPGMGETLLRMKAEGMARDYQQLFGSLAREYRITLLAGSLLLPEPRLENGKLRTGKGPLYNLAPAFGPDGNLLGPPHAQPCLAKATGQVTVQEVHTEKMKVLVSRKGCQSPSLVRTAGTKTSIALFLRGRLWPFEDLAGCCGWSAPAQERKAPGSHLLNIRVIPQLSTSLPAESR
ncbi:hypothetical protein [Azotobacter armeniacus]